MEWAVEVNVVVVVAVEKRTDVERAAQAKEMADQVRVTKRDVSRVIRAKTRPPHGHTMAIAFAPRQLEHISHNPVFVGVVRSHPIGGMNRFVIKAFEIDRVRAIKGDFATLDVPGN